ncbi:MAG: MotA/TolQ/ExbB proton channel family protein [Myxococcales bacterium]|nr:MotA/TolQ/ExbB proton channel family protein [Myxococcales bacterium]
MKHLGYTSFFASAVLVGTVAFGSLAQAEPTNLDELLKVVKAGNAEQNRLLKQRETAFRRNRAEQSRLLAAAKKEQKAAEKKGTELEKRFRDNELKLAELEKTLKVRLGTMGELFGVVRQVAADTAEQVRSSLVTVDKPGRVEKLLQLGASTELPSIDELRHLWVSIQEEMTEAGKVRRFVTNVSDAKGNPSQQEVVRVGAFNLVSNAGFLEYEPKTQTASVLGRQPPAQYIATSRSMMSAQSGMVRFAVDPSRGAILGLLVEAPTLEERLQLGGAVGYIILGLGFFALLVGIVRFVMLLLEDIKMRSQQRTREVRTDNPLGRVLRVYEDNRDLPTEDLERKLDEVIVRESGRVDRFIWIVKVVAGAAPLLGLLGTVTGMIRTFQTITLFGTGDPRLMAGGISEALVTTMLGLVVAIPLVLVHAVLTNSSKRIIDTIEEQAAGVVARRAESEGARG